MPAGELDRPGLEKSRSSRFGNSQDRSRRVRELLSEGLVKALAEVPGPVQPPAAEVGALTPNQAATEAAVVLAAFMIAEGRVLNLSEAAGGDLPVGRRRLEGDRTCSEHLSRDLVASGIPCTQGAFRSSTYRMSYVAEGAATQSLGTFVEWAAEPTRQLDEVETAFRFLLSFLASRRVRVEMLPVLSVIDLSYSNTTTWIGLLLDLPSRGANAQYLVAALLEAVLRHEGSDVTVHTKRSLASDSASGASGDIELRRRSRLLSVIEVSQGPWHTKLEQAVRAAWRANVDDVRVIADAVALDPRELAEAAERATVGIESARQVLDVKVLDLRHELHSLVGRLDRPGRGHAIRGFDALLRRHELERQPELIDAAMLFLRQAGLAEPAR